MSPERPGVVVHLNDGSRAKQDAVLRNVVNLRAELDAGVAVEVVVHGAAIALVTSGSDAQPQVHELLASGVAFAACANSLRSQHVQKGAVVEGVQIVPAGVAHLARRQFEGWAYLRP